MLIAYHNSFQPLGSLAIQPTPKGVEVHMVKPQYKPWDSLGHYHDLSRVGRETTIVPAMGFSRPTWIVDLKNFLDTLMFWKTTYYPGSLDCSKVVPIVLWDNYSLDHIPYGTSDHSIIIYYSSRCR